MKFDSTCWRRRGLWVSMAAALAILPSRTMAQSVAPPPPAPAAPQHQYGAAHAVLARFTSDEWAIWSSPLHATTREAPWLVSLFATTAALVPSDRTVAGELGESPHLADASHTVSLLGSGTTTFAAAGGLYMTGRLAHDARMREAGALGFEALVHGSIAVNVLKFVAGRERPGNGSGSGFFRRGGTSFPSGHATTAWALGEVVAETYHDRLWVRCGAYALAGSVGVARVTGRNHYPSDVLVGSALGYAIGRFTVHRHGTASGQGGLVQLQPRVEPHSGTSGLEATISF